MTVSEKLLLEIEQFMLDHEMHATAFGLKAVGDRAFVFRLRSRKAVRSDTMDRILEFMAEYRSKDGKSRPKQTPTPLASCQ